MRTNTPYHYFYYRNKQKNPGRSVPRDVQEAVRAYPKCYICFWEFEDGEQVYIEHVWPISNYGTNNRRNLRAACFYCNSHKGNKTFGWKYPPRPNQASKWAQYNADVREGVMALRRECQRDNHPGCGDLSGSFESYEDNDVAVGVIHYHEDDNFESGYHYHDDDDDPGDGEHHHDDGWHDHGGPEHCHDGDWHDHSGSGSDDSDDDTPWCRYGSDCRFGSNCWYRHADGDFDSDGDSSDYSSDQSTWEDIPQQYREQGITVGDMVKDLVFGFRRHRK